MAEQRSSGPSAPTKTAATQRTSQRAERAIEHCERKRAEQSDTGGSRAGVLRRREPTCFSSATDDEVGGDQARSPRSERKRAEQSDTVGVDL